MANTIRMSADEWMRRQQKTALDRVTNRSLAGAAEKALKREASLRKFQAKGRLPKSQMNRTEQAYSALLEQEKAAGRVLAWQFHTFRIKLADGVWYEPDFMVLMADGHIAINEVKGAYTTEKGQMKLRLVCEAMPWFEVVKCIKQKDGSFTREVFSHHEAE